MTIIEIRHGDITKLNVDCIVNAAHTSLLGGGGVDGAIHRAAGKELRFECSTLGGCKTGNAKITKGYNLPARYVIHVVGPVWSNNAISEKKKMELLKSCYLNALKLAQEYNLKTIAFPSISCGAYRCPVEIAISIAFNSVIDFVQHYGGIEKIIFIDIKQDIVDEYNKYISLYNDYYLK